MLAKITTKPETIYITHIVGTRIVVILAMLLIPPIVTSPIKIATTSPKIQALPCKKLCSPPVIKINWCVDWLI